MVTREILLRQLEQEGVLKNSFVKNAFYAIDRVDFVPEHLRKFAYENHPLEIGFGQTISQPYTVAFMLDLLDPQPGEKILEIGSGSGWQTALLAHIVSQKSRSKIGKSKRKIQNIGKIYAIELIPELYELGKKNIAKYNFIEKGIVEFYFQDGSKGLPQKAPFDKIIAAASAEEIPGAWEEQLCVGGRIVAPVKDSIIRLTKRSKSSFKKEVFLGFVFVPLVRK